MSILIATFLLAAMIFLFAIGRPPLTTLGQMALYAFGDSYSISESFVKATPILLCALAVILPARLGLISVVTPKYSVYSLRHSFKDRLKDVECPEEMIDELMGHKIDKPKYGDGYGLRLKLKNIQAIAFTPGPAAAVKAA